MYNANDVQGHLCEAIQVHTPPTGGIYNFLKNELPIRLKKSNLPGVIYEDTYKSGGIFGSKYPMLIIANRSAPTHYFFIGIIVNGNIISFPFLGESDEITKLNKKKRLEEEGKFIRAAMVKSDEMLLQQENAWYHNIQNLIESMFH